MVFDSLSELRLLAGNPLRYRRQILSLKQFFSGRKCTVMLLDDLTATDRDLQIQSIAHGVILLEQLNQDYGPERRRLRVVKYRGSDYLGGYQDYVIKRGGLVVFPRLAAADHRQPHTLERMSTGIPAMDDLLGGGFESGSSTLIVGAPGTGKSTLSAQFVVSAAKRGQPSTLFIFDENKQVLLGRCEGLGIGLTEHLSSGLIKIQQIDPAELSPGEFMHAVRHAATEGNSKIIVIDSLNGYLAAMPGERNLTILLHEMLAYLGQLGVATIMIGAQSRVYRWTDDHADRASYLADAVLLLRYFEAGGEIRRRSRSSEARRRARADHPRVQSGRRRRPRRRAPTSVPRHPHGRPRLRRPFRDAREGADVTDVLRDRLERRVRILALTVRDAQVSSAVLREAGIDSFVCSTGEILVAELNRGAGAVLIAEEAFTGESYATLKGMLERQLPWSDLPLIILTRPGVDSEEALETTSRLGNVTLLERPVRITALVSAVRAALRARARQYQIRAHLRDREIAAEALKDADRRKDEFLAILAHELRNPLAPIRNALAIMKLAGQDAVATQGLAEMLERQVDHMVRLVDDLFEVSRITRGMIELRKQRIDMASVLRDVVATSRPMLDAARQSLHADVDPEPLVIDGDPVRLAQVFGNLVNNASKFSDEGGSLWLTARRRGDAVEVSLKDAGRGIPRAMLPRIFDMFTQVDRRASRRQSGLGIGLTLVKSLVELHGGEIHARSDGPGRGSEFVVHLPLAKEITMTREAPASRSFPTGAAIPRRVLVVDDNRDSADSIAMLLKLLGADVHVVYDGPGALSAIDAFQPSVVLLDIGLPSMDGYEVARRIRQRPELNALTLIALTGWGQTEDRVRSREAGFQHHLVKPADPTVLQSLLETPSVA